MERISPNTKMIVKTIIINAKIIRILVSIPVNSEIECKNTPLITTHKIDNINTAIASLDIFLLFLDDVI